MLNTKTYFASGQFRDGTEYAYFPICHEGLDAAYDFVRGAADWQI